MIHNGSLIVGTLFTLWEILERWNPRSSTLISNLIQFLNPSLLFILAHFQNLIIFNRNYDVLFCLEFSHFCDNVSLMLNGLDQLLFGHFVALRALRSQLYSMDSLLRVVDYLFNARSILTITFLDIVFENLLLSSEQLLVVLFSIILFHISLILLTLLADRFRASLRLNTVNDHEWRYIVSAITGWCLQARILLLGLDLSLV